MATVPCVKAECYFVRVIYACCIGVKARYMCASDGSSRCPA